MQLWGKIVYQDCTLQLCCNALLWWRISLSQHLKTKNTKTFYCLFQLGDHSIPSDVIIKVLIKKIEKHRLKSKVIKGRWGKFCLQILCWPNHTLVSKFSQCSAAAFSAALQGQSCSVENAAIKCTQGCCKLTIAQTLPSKDEQNLEQYS